MTSFIFSKPLYSIKEVGDMLSYSRSTIHRRIKEGKLVSFSLGPNSVRITADSLQRYVSSGMMGSQMGS